MLTENRLRYALLEIVQILGPVDEPCLENKCEGCWVGMLEAYMVAKKALSNAPDTQR